MADGSGARGVSDSHKGAMCVGCGHKFEVGERFIKDTASGFLAKDGHAPDPEIDGLLAGIFGDTGDKVRFCEGCTEPGGDYLWETFYGDEAEANA